VGCFVVDEVEDVLGAGEVAGVGDGLLNQECFAGVGEVAAGDGEVVVVAAAAFVSFFFEWLRLGTLAEGLAVGVGETAKSVMAENPINVAVRRINLFITI
jgi:hypothetical protein